MSAVDGEVIVTGGVEDRSLRYSEFLDVERLALSRVSIIGVGAVGRQVALQLAAMGSNYIQLVDFDSVEGVNLGPQGYWPSDIGKSKVDATAELIHHVNPACEVKVVDERWTRVHERGDVIFSCVDDMSAREFIWKNVRRDAGVGLLVDGRMALQTIRILTASSNLDNPLEPDSQSSNAWDYYGMTLFSNEDAVQQSCTVKSTLYTASICAGLMINQYVKWLRNDIMSIEPDFTVDLYAGDMGPYRV